MRNTIEKLAVALFCVAIFSGFLSAADNNTVNLTVTPTSTTKDGDWAPLKGNNALRHLDVKAGEGVKLNGDAKIVLGINTRNELTKNEETNAHCQSTLNPILNSKEREHVARMLGSWKIKRENGGPGTGGEICPLWKITGNTGMDLESKCHYCSCTTRMADNAPEFPVPNIPCPIEEPLISVPITGKFEKVLKTIKVPFDSQSQSDAYGVFHHTTFLMPEGILYTEISRNAGGECHNNECPYRKQNKKTLCKVVIRPNVGLGAINISITIPEWKEKDDKLTNPEATMAWKLHRADTVAHENHHKRDFEEVYLPEVIRAQKWFNSQEIVSEVCHPDANVGYAIALENAFIEYFKLAAQCEAKLKEAEKKYDEISARFDAQEAKNTGEMYDRYKDIPLAIPKLALEVMFNSNMIISDLPENKKVLTGYRWKEKIKGEVLFLDDDHKGYSFEEFKTTLVSTVKFDGKATGLKIENDPKNTQTGKNIAGEFIKGKGDSYSLDKKFEGLSLAYTQYYEGYEDKPIETKLIFSAIAKSWIPEVELLEPNSNPNRKGIIWGDGDEIVFKIKDGTGIPSDAYGSNKPKYWWNSKKKDIKKVVVFKHVEGTDDKQPEFKRQIKFNKEYRGKVKVLEKVESGNKYRLSARLSAQVNQTFDKIEYRSAWYNVKLGIPEQ